MDTFLYITGGVVSLLGTFIAVSARHIFHAALGLAIALAGTAGLFVPLGGELISVVQLLVYLGAVAIAIVFTLMLSPPYYMARPRRNPLKIAAALAVSLLIAIPFVRIIFNLPLRPAQVGHTTGVAAVGHAMLSDFVFPFEIISLVLTVTIIGAVVLARDLPRSDAQEESRLRDSAATRVEHKPEAAALSEDVR